MKQRVFFIIKFIIRIRIIKTLRVNFGLLPFKEAIKLPILVRGKLVIDSLKGKVVFDCPIRFGLVIIGKDLDNMPIALSPSRIFVGGTLIFKGKCLINHSANLVVWPHGIMEVGRYVVVSSGVLLKSTCSVKIGDYTRLISGCFIQDSNVHLVKEIDTGIINKVFKPIVIGKGCWIGMNSTILGGAVIPDYSVSGRYTFFNKDYSKEGIGCLFVGSPAKIVKTNVQRLFNISYEEAVTKYFINNPDAETFYGEPGLEVVNDSELDPFFQI